MTPKSLLRHKLATSKVVDFKGKTHFRSVIPEENSAIKAKEVTRVVFCSGKVYYYLVEAREAAKLKNVAIVRLEQLYPFPHDLVVT
ncbi:MAG: alpha-ketoglutarate decarboxylase, partial [Proteobacteria bacterium]|nr:alpha-ketoglutarate decarboxylase [Pseudomonadota bacterium]